MASTKTRRKKNAKSEDDSIWPWLLGVGAAVGVGAVAIRVLRGGSATQAPAQPPAPVQLPSPRGVQPHGLPLQGFERDRNGIPMIPLPAESAARTAQARRGRPEIPSMNGDDGQGGGGQEYQESFGGGGGGEGSRLGGESF